MFFYFLKDYKEFVYKGPRRKLRWYECAMLILLIVTVLAVCISAFLEKSLVIQAACAALLVIQTMVLGLYTYKRDKKNRAALFTAYKERRIDGLVGLLKASKYNLYSVEGIEWLVECCKNKPLHNEGFKAVSSAKHFLISAVFPVITLCLGLVLKETETADLIEFIVLALILMAFLFFLYLILKPAVIYLIYPQREAVNFLQDELGYIKTQIIKGCAE